MPFKPVPRLRGFAYRGSHAYSLTICTHAKRPIFVDEGSVAPVMAQLLRTAADYRFAIPAYCFMPDHMHAVLEGRTSTASLTEFVPVFKQRSAHDWKHTFRGSLWQRSYFEHVIRDEEDRLRALRYVLENPLRAGLVTRLEDYPYVGSMTMPVRENGFVICRPT